MRGNASPLQKAYRLYYAKEYAKVIALLEPQVFMYRENPNFYRLLGLACLHTRDLGGAESFLMRCMQLDRDAVAPRLELAACYFAKRDNESAIELWLEILDDEPENRYAARGLKVLRTGPESDTAERYRESGRLRALYPDIRRPIPWIRAGTVAVLGTVLVLAAVNAPDIVPAIQATLGWERSQEHREGVENIDLSDESELTQDAPADGGEGDAPRYELSDSEIEATFDRMREYFLDERDNMANREINRILHSNATSELKTRAKTLQGYLKAPSFADFSDGFSYEQVTSDPWLYDGAHVRWRGRPSNVDINEERIAFDFLVGYEDGRELDGVVPTEFDFAVRMDSSYVVEILARVEREDGEEIALQGVSSRVLGPAEGS
ncbi:MAG: tetratricopeptide repeat protein [Spirochaetales bacterium]